MRGCRRGEAPASEARPSRKTAPFGNPHLPLPPRPPTSATLAIRAAPGRTARACRGRCTSWRTSCRSRADEQSRSAPRLAHRHGAARDRGRGRRAKRGGRGRGRTDVDGDCAGSVTSVPRREGSAGCEAGARDPGRKKTGENRSTLGSTLAREAGAADPGHTTRRAGLFNSPPPSRGRRRRSGRGPRDGRRAPLSLCGLSGDERCARRVPGGASSEIRRARARGLTDGERGAHDARERGETKGGRRGEEDEGQGARGGRARNVGARGERRGGRRGDARPRTRPVCRRRDGADVACGRGIVAWLPPNDPLWTEQTGPFERTVRVAKRHRGRREKGARERRKNKKKKRGRGNGAGSGGERGSEEEERASGIAA